MVKNGPAVKAGHPPQLFDVSNGCGERHALWACVCISLQCSRRSMVVQLTLQNTQHVLLRVAVLRDGGRPMVSKRKELSHEDGKRVQVLLHLFLPCPTDAHLQTGVPFRLVAVAAGRVDTHNTSVRNAHR